MSDIPLHSIRRQKARAGYTPLTGTESETEPMPASVQAAAASSSRRKHNLFQTRKDRYVDDPTDGEDVGLLADGEQRPQEHTHRRSGSASVSPWFGVFAEL
jgi:hypothetical protein